MKYDRSLVLTVFSILMAMILIDEARAMPVFARKYKTSCMTCHVAFPRRNAVGEAFRINGFRFEDDEIYRKEPPVEMGDDAYERLFPDSIWPSDIPLTAPISISGRFLTEFDVDGSRKNNVTFLLPEELELVWAGTLGDDISFYGDIIYLQKDFGGQPVQAWTTLKAWLEFQNLIGESYHLNLRLGTVGTASMGLLSALDANNFSTHFYQYTTWMMPGVDLTQTGLEEFEGNPFSLQPQMGFELNGHGDRWAYATGVVAGNVMSPGNEQPDGPLVFNGTARNLNNKDCYGQLTYKFGGLPFTGINEKQEEDASPLTAKSDFWRDDSLMLSAWGYLGMAQIVTATPAQVGTDAKVKIKSDFWRAGAGFLKKYKDIDIGAGYILGCDKQPYGSLTHQSVDSQTWFVETMGFVYPWLLPYLRYEGMILDMPEGIPGVMDNWKIQRLLPGFKAMVRANIAITVELPLYFEGAALEEGFDRSLFALMSIAF